MRRTALMLTMIACALLATQADRRASEAHIVPGEYSFYMQGHYEGLIGDTIEVVLGVEHGSNADCSSGFPGIYGCYQSLQIRTNFGDADIVTTSLSAMFPDPAIVASTPYPGDCAGAESLYTGLGAFALQGCLNLCCGAAIDYSGDAFHVVFTCIGPGIETLTFEPENSSPGTFANDGAIDWPSHFHDGLTITCWDLPPGDDMDGDGCTNAEEVAPNEVLGGQRNPADPWDFYDVTNNAVIDFQDTLRILQHFGHGPQADATERSHRSHVPGSGQALADGAGGERHRPERGDPQPQVVRTPLQLAAPRFAAAHHAKLCPTPLDETS